MASWSWNDVTRIGRKTVSDWPESATDTEGRDVKEQAERMAARRRPIHQRVLLGLGLLAALYLLYRFIWLAGWYWPYRLICDYLKNRLPMTAPWVIESAALVVCVLAVAQAGSIVSFIIFGRHKRLMLGLVAAGIVVHAGLGWYSHDRVAVDERGRVRVRVVERPDGSLKVIDRDFDPETGRPAHWATDADLAMLDLQRRNQTVTRVGLKGPFRSLQGTIIVYYTRRDGRIVLYTGPRHRDVSGEMQLATDEVLADFVKQQVGTTRRRR
jgi:hypothetical protein